MISATRCKAANERSHFQNPDSFPAGLLASRRVKCCWRGDWVNGVFCPCPTKGRASQTGQRREGTSPAEPRTGEPHHRRFDLPGEPGPLLHPAVSGGVSRPVQARLEEATARDP